MKLTSKARKSLPAKDFGLPGSRRFPLENKAHARDAKARASEMFNKGKISGAQHAEIDRKADAILKR
jgi:hypothetical protein